MLLKGSNVLLKIRFKKCSLKAIFARPWVGGCGGGCGCGGGGGGVVVVVVVVVMVVVAVGGSKCSVPICLNNRINKQ